MTRAAIMPGPNQPVEVHDYTLPTMEPGSILLETVYSEVCGTDVHLQHGRLSGIPYPIIPGHYTDTGSADVNPHADINRKHLEIRGSWGADFSHFYRAMQILSKFGDRLPERGWDQRSLRP